MTRRDFPEAHRQSGPTGQGTGTALPRTPAAMTPQMRRLYSGPAVEPSVSMWEAAQRRMDLFAYQESDEWHLICAHVNTAPPPTPPPTFAHEPVRVAVQYQLEATAPSLRPEPPAAQRVIDAATEFARQQCIALVEEMRTWKPAA